MNNLETLFGQYDITLETSQVDLFGKFLKFFLDKNSQVNLSSIRDESWVIEKHFIDSILLNYELQLSWKILDIWTWWWFPWIPLAITNPDAEFILVDSTRKKIDAVNCFIDELWLTNARWIWGRAEELSKMPEFKKQFDFIVSRATAYLPQIMDLSLPFLKKWWMMIFYKLRNEDEINDWVQYAKKCKLSWFEIKEYAVQDQKRIFIFIW